MGQVTSSVQPPRVHNATGMWGGWGGGGVGGGGGGMPVRVWHRGMNGVREEGRLRVASEQTPQRRTSTQTARVTQALYGYAVAFSACASNALGTARVHGDRALTVCRQGFMLAAGNGGVESRHVVPRYTGMPAGQAPGAWVAEWQGKAMHNGRYAA